MGNAKRNTRHRRGRSAAIAAAHLAVGTWAALPLFRPATALAGNTWDGESATSDNWTDGANWDPDGTPGYGTITFAGAQRATNTNDFSNLAMNQVNFNSASAFTLNGNGISLFDNGGTQAKIENNGSALGTVNLPVTFAATTGTPRGEINAVTADLLFGSTATIALSGSAVNGLELYGAGRTVTLNGVISGSGKYVAIQQGNTVVYGAAHTYTGGTFVNNGTLQIAAGGSAEGSALRIGDTAGSAAATLSLTSAAGGTTVSSLLNVRSGSSGLKSISATNTAGTNTFSGNLFLDADVTTSAATGGTLAFTGTALDLKNQTMTVGGAGSTSISGSLQNSTGSGKLTKTGSGTLTLTGSNSYAGATIVSAGFLNVRHANALGGTAAGTSVAAGAVLQLQGDVAVAAEPLTLNAVLSTNPNPNGLVNVSGTNSWGGPITGVGDNANNFRISATAGSLTVSGNVTAGGTFTSGTGLVTSGSGNVEISGVIAGAMIFTTTAGGTVTLSGANTYTGKTALSQNAGVLRVTSLNSTGAGIMPSSSLGRPTTTATGHIELSGGQTLRYIGAGETTDRTINLQGGATIDQSGTGLLKFTTNITAGGGANRTLTLAGSAAGSGEFAGVIADVANVTSLIKSGTGAWALSGNNTFTGSVTVSASGGTLRLGHAAGLGSATGATTVNAGGALDLNGLTGIAENLTLNGTGGAAGGAVFNSAAAGASTSGTVALGSAMTVGAAPGNITFTGVVSGAQALTKVGAGTLTLGGAAANTFTSATVTAGTLVLDKGTAGAGGVNALNGAVTINGGTVRLNQPQQIPDASPVTVTAGTFDLNGRNETIGGATALTFGGGAAATTSAVTTGGGTLTIGGNVVYSSTNNPGAATFTGNLDLGAATRAFTVNDSTAAATDLTVSGVISSATATTGLTKDNAGTLRLGSGETDPNTYTGVTTLNAGTLVLGKAASPSGGLAIAGDGVASLTEADVVIAGGTLLLDANEQIADDVTVALNTGGTFNLNGKTETIYRLIPGGGNLVTGGGSLIANSGSTADLYLGDGTNVSAPATPVDNVYYIGTTTAATVTGTLTLNSATPLHVFDVANGAADPDTTISAIIQNSAGETGFRKIGAGTLVLSGMNTFTVPAADPYIEVGDGTAGSGGLLSVSADSNLGNVANGVRLQGGGLQATGTFSTARQIRLGSGNGVVDVTAGNTLTLNTAVVGGAATLTKTGPGALVLGQAGTYTGITTVSGGALSMDDLAKLGATASLAIGGGTLQYTGTGLTSLNKIVAASGTGATIDVASSTGTVTQVSPSAVSGSGSTATLTKSGPGRLVLAGGNIFTGSVAVTGGTLSVAGAGTNTSALGGAGARPVTLTNNAVFQVSTGTFDPNASTVSIIIGSGGGTFDTVGTLTLDASGQLSSAAGNLLTKAGAGTLSLGSTQTLAGGLSLAAGSTQIVNASSNITVGGLTLAHTGATILTVTSSGKATLTGNLTFNTGSATTSTTVSSPIDLSATTHTFNVADTPVPVTSSNAGEDLVVSGTVAGTGASVTKTGAGTLTFSGTGGNTFNGGLRIEGGTVLTRANAGATNLGTGTVTLAGGGLAFRYSGPNATNTFNNVSVVADGSIDVNNNGASGSGNTVVMNGLAIGGHVLTVTGGNSYGLRFNGATTLTGNAAFNPMTAPLTLMGAVGEDMAGRSLTKTGAASLTLSGVNSYSGATTVNAGTLVAGAANTIPAGSAVVLANTAGVTLDMSGAGVNQTIGSLAGGGTTGGTVSLGANSLNAGGDNTSTSYAGTITGTGGTLAKSGTGSLDLTRSNTYTGGTTVGGGTLFVNNTTGSATGTGAVNVNAGGTLGGGGAIQNTGGATLRVFINADGSVSPGAAPSTIGDLATGDQTWNAGGAYEWEINDPNGTAGGGGTGVGWDLIELGTAALDLNAAAGTPFTIRVTRVGGVTVPPHTAWFTIAHAGSITDAGTPITPAEFDADEFVLPDAEIGAPSWRARAVAAAGGGVDIQVSQTPEPGSIGLFAAGAAGLLRRRPRVRRSPRRA